MKALHVRISLHSEAIFVLTRTTLIVLLFIALFFFSYVIFTDVENIFTVKCCEVIFFDYITTYLNMAKINSICSILLYDFNHDFKVTSKFYYAIVDDY